jgi:hypothetical protein
MKHEWDAKRIQTLRLQLIIHVMELFEYHCVVLPLEEGKFTYRPLKVNARPISRLSLNVLVWRFIILRFSKEWVCNNHQVCALITKCVP